MERKSYNKPFMVREQFLPQDFVAACDYEVNINPLPFDRAYSRIDINGNGIFEETYAGGTGPVDYTERGWDLIGTTHTVLSANSYQIIDVNVYKYTGPQIGAGEETGSRYDNGKYTLVATKMLYTPKYNKYYFIGAQGEAISQVKNQS